MLTNLLSNFILLQDSYLYELNKGLIVKNNYNDPKFIFLFTKNMISMILPNNGKVFGYPIFNNCMNFGYNILLKQEKDAALKLKQHLIFHNGNTIISLSFFKEYFSYSKKMQTDNNNIIKKDLVLNQILLNNKEVLSGLLVYNSILDDNIFFDINNYIEKNNSLIIENLNVKSNLTLTWDKFLKKNPKLYKLKENFFNELELTNNFINYNSLLDNEKEIEVENVCIKGINKCKFFFKKSLEKDLQSICLTKVEYINPVVKKKKIVNFKDLKIYDIKKYIFLDNINNLLLKNLNKLDKNETNFKFILNFLRIFYSTNFNNNLYLYVFINSYDTDYYYSMFEKTNCKKNQKNYCMIDGMFRFLRSNRNEYEAILRLNSNNFIKFIEIFSKENKTHYFNNIELTNYINNVLENNYENPNNIIILEQFFLLEVLTDLKSILGENT
jgi:hypothetical protein